MTDPSQRNKFIVQQFHAAIAAASIGNCADVLAQAMSDDVVWNGPHPFNTQVGPKAIADAFWIPLKNAMPNASLRTDILMAGAYDGGDWVTCTGFIVGEFQGPWLGIPPHDRALMLRFGAFYRLMAERIVEVYILYDLIDAMRQAGVDPLPPSTGANIVVPGPCTHDGLLLAPQSHDEGRRSLDLVEAMLFEGLAGHHETDMSAAVLAEYWHPNMVWYGPGGIGTTYGIDGFKTGHQIPFRRALSSRKGGDHKCRIGEGAYVASTGWPSYRAVLSGEGWLGLPATNKPISMRVMDWWRREGDRLHENWVLIDLLDLFLQVGDDVLGRVSAPTTH